MHTVQLNRELAAKGLAVVSVSLDEPEDEPAVLEFLRGAGANFDNLISKFGTSTESFDALDIRGDLPFYQLFDRSGQLRYQFAQDPDGLENGESFDQIDARVRELLAEK